MVKQITIISGKGGTGKTTVTAALAYLAKDLAVFADADVDAPDLHLLLHPDKLKEEKLYISKKIKRNNEKCIKCNKCGEACRFHAITATDYDYYSCEGCGLCVRICPEKALEMETKHSAKVYTSNTRFGPFIHADMEIGEGNSGRIVDRVRHYARETAKEHNKQLVILDGSPGIGCPVIASITGIDLACIIVEPTLSGIHDLERVVGITNHFNVDSVVCVNKYDINKSNTEKIEEYCEKNNIPMIAKIPFDRVVPESILKGLSIFEMEKNRIMDPMELFWSKIKEILEID